MKKKLPAVSRNVSTKKVINPTGMLGISMRNRIARFLDVQDKNASMTLLLT